MNDSPLPLNVRQLALFAIGERQPDGFGTRASISEESRVVLENMPGKWADRVTRTILGPLDFDIEPQRILFIVGESGIGKSLLARTLMGLCDHQENMLFTIGDRILCSFPHAPYLLPEGQTTWTRSTGIIFQEPSSYLNPVLSIGHQVYECHPGIPSADTIESFIQDELSVPRRRSFFKMYPADLSEGQKQRVLIGMNVARPQLHLMIADEPTSALDPVTRNQIISLIAAYYKATGASLIFITHDPVVIQRLAQEAGVLGGERGASVLRLQGRPPEADMMTVSDYLHQAGRRLAHTSSRVTYPLWLPSREYHGYLAGRPGSWERLTDTGSEGTDAHERWRKLRARCVSGGLSLRDFEESMHEPTAARGGDQTDAEAFMEIKDLSFFYGPRKASPGVIIGGEGISVAGGEIVGLLGESGAGKTTLMKVIGGLMTSGARGSASVFHPPLRRIIDMLHASESQQRAVRRHTLQIVFQNPDSALDPNMTMNQALREVTHWSGEAPDESYIEWLVDTLYLMPRLREAFQTSLSGGERYRFALIRALLLKPALLIADEPFASIDYITREALVALFQSLARGEVPMAPRRTGFLIISHNMEALMKICHRIYVLARPLGQRGEPLRYSELIWGGHPLEGFTGLDAYTDRYRGIQELRGMMAPDILMPDEEELPVFRIEEALGSRDS